MKRALAVLAIGFLVGCSGTSMRGDATDGGADDAAVAACPTTAPRGRSSCAGMADGTRCSYPGPGAEPNECRCSAGQWFCNSCGFTDGFPPTSTYSCATRLSSGCVMDTWEWQIRCSCWKPELTGQCCGSESLDRYYNCQPERLREGGPCCASCPSTPVDGGSKPCSCGADSRFHCT